MPKECNCDETKFKSAVTRKNERFFSDYHNCAEVRRRNSFLPFAERLAKRENPNWHTAGGGHPFSRSLSRHMDRLCRKFTSPLEIMSQDDGAPLIRTLTEPQHQPTPAPRRPEPLEFDPTDPSHYSPAPIIQN